VYDFVAVAFVSPVLEEIWALLRAPPWMSQTQRRWRETAHSPFPKPHYKSRAENPHEK
jgi:hypothetical protein